MSNFETLLSDHLVVASHLDCELFARLENAVDVLTSALALDLPLLVCGNGRSAADAQHIAGELVGKFLAERRALNVIALSVNTSVITAWGNDVSFDTAFSRQVDAHGRPGGVLWVLSTSDNSSNVVRAAEIAKERGMLVLAMTGKGGGQLAGASDLLLEVPTRSTPRIQEYHILFYHHLCEQVENRLRNSTHSHSS